MSQEVRVAVFRPDDDRLTTAVELLDSLGATPVADPMLEIKPTGAVPRSDADYVVFTSKTGIELADEAGWQPGDTTLVSIGSGTTAAPGVAGVPLTHRDHVSSVSFVTGHEDPSKDESAVDWEALADTGGTLVVLMGVGKLPLYTQALRDAGMDPETPVALVERATWPEMTVATGTLDSIVEVRDEVGIEPPAITVIGDVAATREAVVDFLLNRSDDTQSGATDR